MLEQQIENLTAAIVGLTESLNASRSQVSVAAAAAPAPAAEKPKAEKKADAPKVEEKKPEPAAEAKKEEAKPEAAKVEEKKPEVTTSPVLTYEDVKAAFLALNQKKGREATVTALRELGVGTVPELQAKSDLFDKAVAIAKKAAE